MERVDMKSLRGVFGHVSQSEKERSSNSMSQKVNSFRLPEKPSDR